MIKFSFKEWIYTWRNQKHPELYCDYDFLNYIIKKRNGLRKNLNTIKTLCVRASNADYGFFPQKFPNSYNLGLTSLDLEMTFKIYEKWQKTLPSLKNIIMYFSVSSPGYVLTKTSERYRAVSYGYFFGVKYSNENILPKYEKYIRRQCQKIENTVFPIYTNYRGYEKKYFFMNDISAEIRSKKHLRENLRMPDQMCWLSHLDNLAKQNNHRLIIVLPPCRRDYRAQLPTGDVLFSKIYRLDIEKWRIFNYYDDAAFVGSDFGDTDHLNENGAKKLTKMIYDRCNNLELL